MDLKNVSNLHTLRDLIRNSSGGDMFLQYFNFRMEYSLPAAVQNATVVHILEISQLDSLNA